MANEGGKGCKPRPFSVTQDEYDNRWDAIFNKKNPCEEDKETELKDIKETKE